MSTAPAVAAFSGWGITRVSRRRHYFNRSVSLCRQITDAAPTPSANRNKRLDCWICARRAARLEKAKKS